MATDTVEPSLPRSDTPVPPPGPRRGRRAAAMGVWATAFVACWVTIGLPTEPVYMFGWLWTATIAWRVHLPVRQHLSFLRDWAPVVGLLVVYNLSRGFAESAEPHVTELIEADRWLVGWFTGGQVPTVWLQEGAVRPGPGPLVGHAGELGLLLPLRPSDRRGVGAVATRPAPVGGVHAPVPVPLRGGSRHLLRLPGGPAVVGVRARVPAAEVVRISTRGWAEIGLHGAFNALNSGQLASNPVAAMPSLHTAWALFVVAFFLPAVARRWWPLLLAYPLAMALTLMYTGEHYLIDVFAGWAYVGVTFLVVGLAERWWRARRARVAAPA